MMMLCDVYKGAAAIYDALTLFGIFLQIFFFYLLNIFSFDIHITYLYSLDCWTYSSQSNFNAAVLKVTE